MAMTVLCCCVSSMTACSSWQLPSASFLRWTHPYHLQKRNNTNRCKLTLTSNHDNTATLARFGVLKTMESTLRKARGLVSKKKRRFQVSAA